MCCYGSQWSSHALQGAWGHSVGGVSCLRPVAGGQEPSMQVGQVVCFKKSVQLTRKLYSYVYDMGI